MRSARRRSPIHALVPARAESRRSRLVALLAAAALVLGAAAPSASAQEFMGIGDLPGGVFSSVTRGLSRDGTAVTGQSSSDQALPEAFLWTDEDGIQGLGDLPGGLESSVGNGAADGGDAVAGVSDGSNGNEAFLWDEVNGMVGLGDLPSTGFFSSGLDVSSSGMVVVGAGTSVASEADAASEAFRWTEATGLVGLGDLPGGIFQSFASALDSDGDIVVGRSESSNGPEAFRWDETNGMVGLGDLSGGDFSSRALGVSDDGTYIVGRGNSDSGNEAFLWDAVNGMVGLGDLPGGTFDSMATGVTSDGGLVVGTGNTADGDRAFVWTESEGIRDLKSTLESEFGLDLTDWTLTTAEGISDDGNVVAGQGINPSGNVEGWVVFLPEPGAPGLVLAVLGALGVLRGSARRPRP